MHAGSDINAERVDNLFLITRGNIIPAVARLTHEQAAAFMVLGQSMESSAGDPTQAGTIKNEFFYDPFMAGDPSEHANLFYEILRAIRTSTATCLNTGFVGEGGSYRDIRLADTMGILNEVLRGELHEEWVFSPKTRPDGAAFVGPGRFDTRAARKAFQRGRLRCPAGGFGSSTDGVDRELRRLGSAGQGRVSGPPRAGGRVSRHRRVVADVGGIAA